MYFNIQIQLNFDILLILGTTVFSIAVILLFGNETRHHLLVRSRMTTRTLHIEFGAVDFRILAKTSLGFYHVIPQLN